METHRDMMPDSSSASRQRSARPLSKNAKRNRRRNEKKRKRRQAQLAKKPLPVKDHARAIAEKVKENQVVIITAETGCGKSSQVPQILLRDVLHNEGVIACTQPRRIAASSLAERVAQEMGVEVGEKVGYHVRFDRRITGNTQIKYMTDGILVRECLFNMEAVEKYSVIIIDEVHERSIQMDLLLGFMKTILPKCPDMRLVVMSATMNTDNVSHYFDGAPVLKLEGTMHHQVDICYQPGFTNEHILKVITEIINNYREGDILVFLPGEPEILKLEKDLKKLGRCLRVLPAHSQLPPWRLNQIFDAVPKGQRKVILSTNVAESSITLEGLRFVVDTGYVNVKVFDGKTGVNQLETRLISKSEAQQRRGRIGRTCPGFCYRLYKREQLHSREGEEDDDDNDEEEDDDEEDEEEEEEEKETERCFQDSPVPQIERDDLTHLVLMLKWTEFGDVANFPWLTSPNEENVAAAKKDLVRLGALDAHLELTESGRHMVMLPLHPRMAAVIWKSKARRLEYPALLLASILSAFSGGRQGSLRKLAESRFGQAADEATALIAMMREFLVVEASDDEVTNAVHNFATFYNIATHNLLEAVHVFKQLVQIMKKCGHVPRNVPSSDIGAVLTEVFAANVGKRCETSDFKLPGGFRVKFQPTLSSRASRAVLSQVGGMELFCLRDIRKERKDVETRLITTFVPTSR